ncbi:TonB-dependent receptor [Allomuricauda sp. XS_ASV26]|jgi:outer membrane receptor protein involved in Fe transport|uniref:TonB-dependent receptor n=1 Tax=Flagellimonas marinaquae TaxID=254955 RepID=A0AA48HBE9_9FLAO|nr:TonB-dependent receptor [Allomuricauda ruestringensis]MCA0958878.1 TonB-dependent receptor [Allomuricauda ruestringensis]BDW92155.1 TonB-dependent receptor [Allomuricauda aquimarina]
MKRFYLAIAAIFVSAMAFAQGTLTGTVVDGDLGGPLPGATVMVKGTRTGTSTDFDGNFTLEVNQSSGTLIVSYIGFVSKSIPFSSSGSLGTISLMPDAEELGEVVVVGTGIIDLATDRQTPIAVSSVPIKTIQEKIGTQDVTMTLVNTPSVYVSGQSGGFGDTDMRVRGFEQDNTAFLLNGQPINGMEDGKMYWSNWSGINDIASGIQIQRGLGSSKLAISSVGGTVNFVTKATEMNEGGFGYATVANNNYIKTSAGYNTGISDKGWGMSVMLSHWQGDGYNEGNFGEGQTYFISVGYRPSASHNFNFLLTGAPQFHDQNFTKPISDYLEYGRRYNNNWGTYNGQYLTERRNFYHKPVANLNWDWTISETANLSTVLYASWGNGGGTGNRGDRIRTAEGRIDYDAIYAFNQSVPNGEGGYFAAGGGYVTRASMNLHNWYGLISNFEKQLSDNLTWNVGFDLRTYYGKHFRVVSDFHGLDSWQENIRLIDQNNNHESYGTFGTYKQVIATESFRPSGWAAAFNSYPEDQKIAYSNDERISYGGLFTQLEYATDTFSTFFQGSISNQYHQRFDFYQYADEALINGTSSQWTGEPLPADIEPGTDSEKVNNFGYNAKAGFSYTPTSQHSFYANAGYYNRQPYHDNIYLNFTNQVNPLTENEKILGLEAGYGFSSAMFSANINLYRTSWKDRVVTSSDVVDDVVTFETNFGTEQLHTGAELDFKFRPMPGLSINGFASIGDWKYQGSAVTQVTDEERNVLSTETVDYDGGKVGGAAQTSGGLGFSYRINDMFSVDSDWRYYGDLYSDVGAVKDNLKLPAYSLMDAGATFSVPLGANKTKQLKIRANVNNLLNHIYISRLTTNNPVEAGDETYKGINVSNQGYFGWGRTWNVTLRYDF